MSNQYMYPPPQYPPQYYQYPPQYYQYPPQPYYYPPQYPARVPNGFGITGFVSGLVAILSIISLEGLWRYGRFIAAGALIVYLGVLLGILGIVFSSIGIRKFRKLNRKNGLAIAGLILGIMALVVFVGLIML